MSPAPRRAGFTLLEVVIAVSLLALMLTFVYESLSNTLRTREAITEELEAPKIETAILDELMRDLRFIYYRPGLLPADAGFWGRSRTVNGSDGDRMDFLTCRDSRRALLEDTNQTLMNSPLVEVGWACRPSDTYDRMLELWRREDYFVDDDPTDGGMFDLVYDKLRSFDLRYYKPGEERDESDNGLEEWDTKTTHRLPYAIVLNMKYDVAPPPPGDRGRQPPPAKSVRRIILLKPAQSVAPDATSMDSGMSTMR